MATALSATELVEELASHYDTAVDALRADLRAFMRAGALPDPAARAAGRYAYPELRLTYRAEGAAPRLPRAYARFSQAGVYATTITRPRLFEDYLTDQLDLLMADFAVEAQVGRSTQEIPFPYVLDGADDMARADVTAGEIARHFPTTELAEIGDEIADGLWTPARGTPRPLSLFDALRTDFSLARLAHYTGAPPEDCQQFVLFTNYQRYVDEFVRWGAAELRRPGTLYDGLSCAGGVRITAETTDPAGTAAAGGWRRHQMPAYHLMAPGRRGDYPGQHRRGPVKRQDDHRPSGGASPAGLADDRPLRRPARQPDDRRLCAGPRLSAR